MAESRFDEQGNEYRLAEVPEDQCLVWSQVIDEEGESYDQELHIVARSALRDAAPRQKVDGYIAEARATLKELRDQIQACRHELQTFEDDMDGRMARLKRHKGLSRLDDYLGGRITHYVEYGYGPPEIVAFEDTKTDDLGHGRDKLKLLTLFGGTNGDLTWGLNRWSDGSGCNRTVIPCTSYDEAREVAHEWCMKHETKALDGENHITPSRSWVAHAAKYGIVMSDLYLRTLATQEAAAKQAEITKLESRLRELEGEDE